MSKWVQKEITLKAKSRGFHLVTDEILKQLYDITSFKMGMCNMFLLHTSASLSVNENADPTVRHDFESYFSRLVPEYEPYYLHTYEGPDDLSAHVKSSVIGCSVNIPIQNGQLKLGCWQGIYLGEHRNNGGNRKLFITMNGV
ncbi:YjbQ family protein [Shewanella sp. 4t3-1-2LB]|uniref:secondary thiamine-phosphate synthase enzyme YjbQ n=1 Tax=Shewanella sp. 4t3-1-2LB TaxID=2817682 RepID=UPI001A9830C1|nr:secondary thiamine-phosphate synthase enzyme YjbQ [Shewanella sp. 4t3-1-2LB]MBO1271124.1 YjbQ family protein [Shewanella sp. 4t3-1-2LB]